MLNKFVDQVAERCLSRLFVDVGGESNCIMVSGVGRSGTTWIGGVLQKAHNYRGVFEPLYPDFVEQSRNFGYFPFRTEDHVDEELAEFTRGVISGKLRSRWLDRDNRPKIYSGRVVKEIRNGYLLPWIAENWPQLPIVLLCRDPMSVYASWVRLNWFESENQKKQVLSFNHLRNQLEFFNKYERFFSRSITTAVLSSNFASFIHHWLSYYLIGLTVRDKGNLHAVEYNDLRSNVSALQQLCADVISRSPSDIAAFSQRSSSTAWSSMRDNGGALDLNSCLQENDYDLGNLICNEITGRSLLEFQKSPLKTLLECSV